MARKGHTTITLDTEILEFFSQNSYNLSGTINEFLHRFISREKDLPGTALNKELLQKELSIFEKEKIKTDLKVKKLREKLEILEENKEKAEVNRLKAEKDRQESLKHCEACGNLIDKPIKNKDEIIYKCVKCLYVG